MKIRTIGRHAKESWKSIFRNGWMTFASISSVTVTLLMVGVFYVILMNLNQAAKSIEEDVKIKVLIDSAADKAMQEQLEAKIKSIPEVDTVTFSSKDHELQQLIKSFGEDGKIFQLYEQENPLYDAFIVTTKVPEDTIKVAEQIEKMDNVYRVNYGKGNVEKLFKIINISRSVGLVLILGLLFTAVFLISNTIKITIVSRRREIEIMRLVGATNGFIRWPFFLEGLWLGMMGAILPIALIITVYKYAYDFLEPKLRGHFIQILDFHPFAYQVGGLLLFLGCLIGIWGSMMSVRKFLNI